MYSKSYKLQLSPVVNFSTFAQNKHNDGIQTSTFKIKWRILNG